MFESLLPAVTLVALGLLGPASVVAMLLARGRHASVSVGGDRRGRVAVAAAFVAAAGGAAGWLLGSGPVASALTALLLATPVAAWAFLTPWWPVRAVVAWAMLVTGSVGALGMATARALDSAAPWTAVPITAVGAALLVFVLGRLNGPFRRLLGIRAGIRRAVRTPLLLRPALLRPALALTVFAAALAAGGLTGVAPRPGGDRAPEAGSGPLSGDPSGRSSPLDGADTRPVSAGTGPATADGTPAGLASPSERGSTASGLGAAPGSPTTAADGPGAGGSATGGGSTGGGSEDGGSGGTASPGDGSTALGDGSGGSTGPTDTVSDTVRDVTDTVEDTTDSGPSGGGGTDPVTSAVEETTEPVVSVVEETTEPVTSGVEETTDPVTDTVEDMTDPVTTVVEDTVEDVTDPIGSTLP